MGSITLLKAGLTDAFQGIEFSTPAAPTEAGAVSALKESELWYNRGVAGGTSGPFHLAAYVFDAALGRYSDAHPALRHLRARIHGVIRTGAPNQPNRVGQWHRFVPGELGMPCWPLAGNCAWLVSHQYAPPLEFGAAAETIQVLYRARYDDVTRTHAEMAGHAGTGILSGAGDAQISEFFDAPAVSSAGAVLTVGDRSWLHRGITRNALEEDYTFNGDAADGALVAGEQYYAVASQPLGTLAIVVTKGNGATAGSAVEPDLPADSLFVQTVLVPFGVASLTLSGTLRHGRGKCEVVEDLTVRAHPVRIHGLPTEAGDPIDVELEDDATSYLWWSSVGGVVVTSTLAPVTAGDFPVWKFVAAAGAVTSQEDLRAILVSHAEELVVLAMTGDEAVTDAGWRTMAFDGAIDRLRLVARQKAVGATGETVFDVLKGSGAQPGTTIFTSFATKDRRPRLAAGEWISSAAILPEVTTFLRGDSFSLGCVALSAGGARASDFELHLVVARVR